MTPDQFDFLHITTATDLIQKRIKQKAKGVKSDHRTRDHERGQSKATIQAIVERVADVRGVEFAPLFSKKRESEAIASARSMAIAACAAIGVPLCHIARAFNRDWATCYLCEIENSNKYRRSLVFRKQWEFVTKDPAVKPLQEHRTKH